ncbi:MAG: hypothetical protein AB7T10_07870 [bacterium]
MKKVVSALFLVLSLAAFSQEIKVAHALIDELYEEENFSMVLKINEGYFSVKEIFLVISESQSDKEQRYEMEMNDKTASVSVPFNILPKSDFYYYFEVTRKDNELFIFPKLPADRLKNKVTRKKEDVYKKNDAILLSPSSETNLTAEDFLFAVYIEGKAGELNLIVDGEDVTEKCMVGKKLLTYNPGRIFQPRRYRFDVINDGILLKTYYFNFASSALFKSLFNGKLSAYSGYESRIDSYYRGSLLLSLYGGLSSFYYKLNAVLGNTSEKSKNMLEDYYAAVGFYSQSVEAGIIKPFCENCFDNGIPYLGVKASASIWNLRFSFGIGSLNDKIYALNSEKSKTTTQLSAKFKSRVWDSEIKVKRFADDSLAENELYKNDDIVLSHSHKLSLFDEKAVLTYSGGFASLRRFVPDSTKSNLSGWNIEFNDSLFAAYSQRISGRIFSRYLNMFLQFSDVSDNFEAFYLLPSESGRRILSFKFDSPLFMDRLILGADANLSYEKDSLSLNLRTPEKRSMDFFMLFSQKNLPIVSITYMDKLWNNMTNDLQSFNQRMYGFRSVISGDFFIFNAKTRLALMMDQLNYKLTEDDSNNFSTGSFVLDASSGIYRDLYTGFTISGRETKGNAKDITSNRYCIKTWYNNLFNLLSPEFSLSAEFNDDTTSFAKSRYVAGSGMLLSLKMFSFKMFLSETFFFNSSDVKSNYLSVSGSFHYSF